MSVSDVFFELGKSRIRRLYISAVHLFALICVWVTFSSWLCFMLSLGLCTTCYYFWIEKHDVSAIEFNKKTEWNLYDGSGGLLRAELLPSSVMWRYLLILNFFVLATQKTETIVIFSDSFSLEEYRVLRRCVKVGYL